MSVEFAAGVVVVVVSKARKLRPRSKYSALALLLFYSFALRPPRGALSRRNIGVWVLVTDLTEALHKRLADRWEARKRNEREWSNMGWLGLIGGLRRRQDCGSHAALLSRAWFANSAGDSGELEIRGADISLGGEDLRNSGTAVVFVSER